jgi:transcriptional regulator with XRE-family HTH domain
MAARRKRELTPMKVCSNCNNKIDQAVVVERYEPDNLGISGVVLINAAEEERCSICGEVESVLIPNLQGLIASAALCRIKNALKLRGDEIRFLRKAMEMTGTELAGKLGVRKEAISRYENNAEPMAPEREKILRLVASGSLRRFSPIRVSTEEIISMRIRPWRPVDQHIMMEFVLVRRPSQNRRIAGRRPKVQKVQELYEQKPQQRPAA